MRAKVKEYLSGILDKVEDEIQVSIKRPPEYEKIKEKTRPPLSKPVETPVEDIIDSKLNYQNNRTMIRQYLCKIVQDAAERSNVDVKFPPQYQSFAKRLHKPPGKVLSDLPNQIADEHTAVLSAIASGTVALEYAGEKRKSITIGSSNIVNEIERTASAIDMMRSKF